MPSRKQLANAIRALSMDAVKQANSGHTGMPLGMADIAEVLWNDYLVHNPQNPTWHNRDRFILSNGHGSMLIYSLLHLTGYDLSINDIKNFRQLGSKTPGHPEHGITPGVETTTGPLGQGLANAVGMAIAEHLLAAEFNHEHHQIIDHYTYVFLGDGCLMEGISHEACSLAGTLALHKLIAFYDDNGISIDGQVVQWFSDNTVERFKAYGWQVIEAVDGHDADAIKKAIEQARADQRRPSLICCKTQIAYGSPNMAGTGAAHGAITSDDEIAQIRKNLNWEYAPFEIPADIYAAWNAHKKGAHYEQKWQQQFTAYEAVYPDLAHELLRRLEGELNAEWLDASKSLMHDLQKQVKACATRKTTQQFLETVLTHIPELLGGSADLSESNCTMTKFSQAMKPTLSSANYIYYGVREFGMSAIMNGIALHGGFIPYGGTFLTFLDYARSAVRMAALMRQRVIFVYTHDSIGLGEDGPTHQPIEHINMLRMTPNMSVWRPADSVEAVVAWQHAIQRTEGPTALLMSRQNLPVLARDEQTLEFINRGAYIINDCSEAPDLILIATGSEVHLAIAAQKQLLIEGIQTRVIAMPSADQFAQQDVNYQQQILPANVKHRLIIEAGSSGFWYRYAGTYGKIIGIDQFGESAPADVLFKHFGFTVEHIVQAARDMLKQVPHLELENI